MLTKRLTSTFVLVVIVLLIAVRLAGDENVPRDQSIDSDKQVTMTGHVVDLYRFLTERGGLDGIETVSKRIDIPTSDSEQQIEGPIGFRAGRWSMPIERQIGPPLYVIVVDATNGKQRAVYIEAREMAGRLVKVTATILERDGVQALRIDKIEPVRIAGDG